jgi:hypothetical protein
MDPKVDKKLDAETAEQYQALITALTKLSDEYRQAHNPTELRFEPSPATLYNQGFICSLSQEWFGEEDKGQFPGVKVVFKGPAIKYHAVWAGDNFRWSKDDSIANPRLTSQQLAGKIFACALNPALVDAM